jgi:hypothetical protein
MTRFRRVLLVSTMAVVAVFAFPSTAYADNCGDLTDCYSTAQAALAALVGLSVLFGLILSFTLDLLPGIGTIKGLIEAYTGRDLITGQELEWWERALGVLPVLGKLGRLAEGAADAGAAARSGRAAGGGGDLFGGISTGGAPRGGGGLQMGGGLGVPPVPGAGPNRGRGLQLDPYGPGRPAPGPRPYQPPLDNRTANTGGIQRINEATDVFGARTVTVEGRVLDSIPDRAGNAPNYNREPHWRDIRNELGVPEYEAAHLWGPGFGDEAAAGIMLAPRELNQAWQRSGAEQYIRDLGNAARANGGEVRLTARATSHGSDVRGGDALLSEVTYDVSLVDRAGNVVDGRRISISVDPPPSGRVHDAEVTNIPPPQNPRR